MARTGPRIRIELKIRTGPRIRMGPRIRTRHKIRIRVRIRTKPRTRAGPGIRTEFSVRTGPGSGWGWPAQGVLAGSGGGTAGRPLQARMARPLDWQSWRSDGETPRLPQREEATAAAGLARRGARGGKPGSPTPRARPCPDRTSRSVAATRGHHHGQPTGTAGKRARTGVLSPAAGVPT